jgi:hypothetical protein
MLIMALLFTSCGTFRIRAKGSMNPRVELEISKGREAVMQKPAEFEEHER